MPKRHPAVAALLLAIFVAGCSAGWRPYSLAASPQPIDERQIIAFNAGGKEYQLHAVRVTADSISGIPWTAHVACEACRVTFGRKDVSNLRTGDPGRGTWSIVLPFVAIVGGIVFVYVMVRHADYS
ncbi:MAG: hypothetical protein ACREL5_12450 [Gemmatimonadales bacterium]